MKLSKQQTHVLELIKQGHNHVRIAELMGLKKGTSKAYIRDLCIMHRARSRNHLLYIISGMANPEPLVFSQRDKNLLNQLKQGKKREQIASQNGVTLSAINRHCLHLYRKVGVTTKRAAVEKAEQLGAI